MELPSWVKLYSAIGILPWYFTALLTQPEKLSIYTIPMELSLMYCHYYFFHRILHQFPEYTINLHVQVHHDKLYSIPRWLELAIDFSFEMLCFCGIPLLMQYCLEWWLISPSVVILASLTLTIGHIFNYSILGSNKIHQTHHANVKVHYGPDFMDHLFGTNLEDHEDGNMHIPPIIVATTITLLLKIYLKWKD